MTSLDVPATFQGSPTGEDGEPWLGYIRVSTWKEEKISPELQRDAILQWARRTGRRIVEWFEDRDESGRHFKRKITQCVERVEERKAFGVAVWRYSRFGRDRTGNAYWLARLESAGGMLESATEPVDASTAIGRFQRGMILEFGAFESDRAGEQWRETHEHRLYKQHLPATGRPRFGYVWHRRWNPRTETLQKERYEVDETLGPIVADLYRDYVAGDGFTALTGRLNRAEQPNARGGYWVSDTLTRYMDSGFAAGLLIVHNPECRCRKSDGSCRNRVHIQGAHEELIDFDLWQAYRQRRKEVRDTAPRLRNGIYELTSLPKCAQCRLGTNLNAAQHNGRNVPGWAYRCGLRSKSGATACEGVLIRRDRVEAAAFKWLAREAARGVDDAPPTDLTPATSPADEEAGRARARVRAQAEVDKQSAALANLRADRAANPTDYGPGEYEAAADVIRRKKATAEAELAAMPEVVPLPDRAEFTPILVGILDEWPLLDTRERNGVYRQLLRRIALIRHGVGADNVEIQFHPRWEPDPWDPAEGSTGR